MDILKGLGIIFMVYGHANGPEHRFFYLFHMAIFVIASGFFYKERYGQSLPAALDFIKRKLRTLYLPFVCFCLPFVLLNNFFIDINFYTNNEAYLALNNSPFAALHEYSRPARLAKEPWHPSSFWRSRNWARPCGFCARCCWSAFFISSSIFSCKKRAGLPPASLRRIRESPCCCF